MLRGGSSATRVDTLQSGIELSAEAWVSEEAGREAENESLGVASPSDVLNHLHKMTTSLEKAWSEALGDEAAEKARVEARGTWNSFVQVHARWTRNATELWSRCGLEALVIEEFPLGDDGLAQLDLESPSIERRYYRLQIAAAYVLLDLVDALTGLENPTGRRIVIAGAGQSESWWEAGAFALIRRRATSLANLLRASEACLEEIVANKVEPSVVRSAPTPHVWEEPLRSASELVWQGWYAAAMPHLLLAIRSILAEVWSVEPGKLPIPLSPSLQGIEALSAVAPHVGLLEAACERMGKGLTVDPGVVVPLAKELTLRVQHLAYTPPSADDLGPLKESGRG